MLVTDLWWYWVATASMVASMWSTRFFNTIKQLLLTDSSTGVCLVYFWSCPLPPVLAPHHPKAALHREISMNHEWNEIQKSHLYPPRGNPLPLTTARIIVILPWDKDTECSYVKSRTTSKEQFWRPPVQQTVQQTCTSCTIRPHSWKSGRNYHLWYRFRCFLMRKRSALRQSRTF